MTDRLTTIAAFTCGPDPASQAELAKIKLNANGVKCFLAGKNFVGMYWLVSNAEGGIKLQVKDSDAAKALEILATNEKIDTGKIEDKDWTPEPINPQCPKCHCEDIEYERFSKKMFFLSILLFRFPIPFSKKSYKCQNCGYTWKQR